MKSKKKKNKKKPEKKFNNQTYFGDSVYSIQCINDCVVGDEVCFDKSIFKWSSKTPKFIKNVRTQATILKVTYNDTTYRHTYTLLLQDGTKKRILAKNLYKNGLFRKPWKDPHTRQPLFIPELPKRILLDMSKVRRTRL